MDRRPDRRPHLLVPSLAVLVIMLNPPGAGAQEGLQGRLAAHAVLAATRARPIPGGGDTSEVRVEQAMIMLDAAGLGSRVRLRATVDFEGWTMPGGVLTPGGWGEGFSDRRHPHTYLHEFVVSGTDLLGARDGNASLSVSAGKGFVAFGTDDPMSRPALRFPVNHHWSQILERAVLIAGYRVGSVALQASLFNGDEPERPGQWPRIAGRFGDSRSGRLTVWPRSGVELQGSLASVKSPEHRPGAGTTQTKWNGSARVEGRAGPGRIYGLAEWARTSEAGGLFVFRSALVEAAWRGRGHRAYYRFERSERPEEERTLDLFRSLRPHLENTILGVTRWTVHTMGYGVSVAAGGDAFRLEPLIELALARVAEVGGGIFNARAVYGRNDLWSVVVGIRLRAGTAGQPAGGHRMGRYGVLAEDPSGHGDHAAP